MKDHFMACAKSIKRLEKDIAREWKRAEPELKRLVREGRYDVEALLREKVAHRTNLIREEILVLRMRMPPFMTLEDGIYHRHPVTPENSHFLRTGT